MTGDDFLEWVEANRHSLSDLELMPWQRDFIAGVLDGRDELVLRPRTSGRMEAQAMAAAAMIAHGHPVAFVGPGSERARQRALELLDRLDRIFPRT